MSQVQWLTALLSLVGIVSTAIFIVAAYKRVNKETFDASTQSWQTVVDTLKEHNSALRDRLDDAEIAQRETEKQLAACNGIIGTMEKDKHQAEKEKSQLMSRNIYLYDLVQTQRARMERAGIDPGAEPNGMEGHPR